jgi:hypothetical protein
MDTVSPTSSTIGSSSVPDAAKTVAGISARSIAEQMIIDNSFFFMEIAS